MSKKPIILSDAGRPEYLDGAMMRYSVSLGYTTLAYFRNPADARQFAAVKAAQSKRALEVKKERKRRKGMRHE